MCPIHVFVHPHPHFKRVRKKKKKENKKYQPANRMHTCHRKERAAICAQNLEKVRGGRTERRISQSKEYNLPYP